MFLCGAQIFDVFPCILVPAFLLSLAPRKEEMPQSLVRLLTVQPFQLLFALISGIFHLFLAVITTRSRSKIRSSSAQNRQMRTEIELNQSRSLYEEYTIVAEQCLAVNVQPYNNGYGSSNNGGNCNATRAWIDGKKWEFSVARNSNSQHTLKLALLEMDAPCTAEISFWQWHRCKQVYILQKGTKSFQQANSLVQFQFNTGSNSPSDGFFNVLIRLLEKRQPTENPFPSFDDNESENVTLIVGPESFIVSMHCLMAVSPVFQRMFSTEMREKTQREVQLEETGPEEFKTFLEAISPPRQTSPNPFNVHELLKLADRFQVDQLRDRCEAHLVNCIEMPLIERLLCAEVYRLNKLKNYVLKSLSGPGLRDFYEENQAALNLLSKELLIQLTSRICTSVKNDRSSLCSNCQRNVSE